MNYQVSIILPSKNRAMRIKKCILQIAHSAPSAETILLIDSDDTASIQGVAALQAHCPNVTVHTGDPSLNAVEKWNLGASLSSSAILVLGEDDLYFHDGWLEQALAALEAIGGSGYVGLNSKNPNGEPAPSDYMATKDWCIEYQGGVLSIPIFSQCGNLASYALAKKSGKCVWADGTHSPFNSIAENCHPYIPTEKGGSVPKASFDATYQLRKDQSEGIDERWVYNSWLDRGMPILWDGVLK